MILFSQVNQNKTKNGLASTLFFGCDTFGPKSIQSLDIWSVIDWSQIGWGPFVQGDQIFGDHLSRGTKFDGDRLSRGTKLVGDHLSMGTKFLGTICPWGQKVGDRKSGDQMGSGPNASQLKISKFNLECPLTSTASKTASPNILKISSNHCSFFKGSIAF